MRPALPALTLLAVLTHPDAAPAQTTPPLHQTVEQAYPQLEYFFRKLVKERDGITIDGRAPFQSHDKFLPGKIATGLADVLLHTPADDPRLPGMLRDYASIADLTVGMENDTWGIYYYIGALYRLKQAGLLERAVRPATLELLRRKLDWRTFVRVPSYELIDLPTNYYGVAFSIARLRLLMGWEDAQASDVLLDRMLKHYADYSGTYGFSDETDGQGRFDRYSILLAAEICERFIETGLAVTPELKALLRKSADVALNAANADGSGFTMGRSLGPYGETAMLEILSTAAYLGVLTPEEKEYAYAYSARIGERYMQFWYDPALHSVDMWGKGRRTDTYRGKHRILGENFSLLHQLIGTDEMWNRAGMKDAAPRADLAAWLERARPPFSLTRFAGGEYDRALAIWRDGPHVFSLSMISGGPGQHANSPYYPLPFSYGIVSGIADSGAAHPQLLPKFRLADGSELIATAFMKHIQAEDANGSYRVAYRQDALTKLGKNVPVKDTRIAVDTTYTLRRGVVVRTDTYTPAAPLDVAGVSLEFASFSSGATVDGTTVAFRDGAVRAFSVDGLANCSADDVAGSEAWRAPYGPMATLASCRTGAFRFDKPLKISWTIRYQAAQAEAQAPAPAAVLATMERVADWQLAHPSAHEATHWTQGVGDAGFMALANLSGTRKYRDAMVAMGERNAWQLGPRTYHADDHVVGQTYAELYLQLRDPAMLAPMKARFDAILAEPHDGSLEFTAPGNQDRWSWCDALFMGPPAWARLAAATGDARYLDHAVAAWWRTSDYLYDKDEHLYYRDSNYFARREANGRKMFWARGNGWVMAGLARTLQYIPANHPARARFEQQFRAMAAKVLALQQDDGMWRASLLDPASYPARETSGTALFAYALAWGINQGLLDRAAFEPGVRRAWSALVASVQPDGKLTHVQPIGQAPTGFAEDATEVYGVGAFLLAGSEVFRMALLDDTTARAAPRTVRVTNPGGFYRADETVELASGPDAPQVVMEADTSRLLPTQRIGDTLLFQANFAPGEERRFLLLPANALPALAPPDVKVHARHVPERYDDFAWESDRIAHRTYGPAILHVPNEHVGSGVDVWLKRVRRPVVDAWYKRGEYHTDHGEGLDNYSVGTGRGCGGTEIYRDGKAYPSSVYAGWKVIADGPLRAVFELRYDAWNAAGRQVAETKRISIDAGANFSRVESRYTSDRAGALPVAVGIAQRKGDGRLVRDTNASWMSYWEPESAPNGHTACAVIVPGQATRAATDGTDALLVGTAQPGQPFVHYLGAGWSRSGDFPDAQAWETHVRNVVQRLAVPLRVTGPE